MLTEIDKQILKEEYPQLSLTDDFDIERYFELRKQGKEQEALKIYNSRLVIKYPDESTRVKLMSYYRQKDPRFEKLLGKILVQLVKKITKEIKKIIDFFSGTVTPLDIQQVYTVIQVCEKIVSAIAPDRLESINFVRKYARYASLLQYREKEMQKASDIIRMYVTDTISSVREFKEEEDNRRKQSKLQAERQKYMPKMLDFSKITFTKAQEASILIPKTIVAVEDKVLAYTMKYWHKFNDGAFENMILLYSRKYKTDHYNIFQSVKIGRLRGWRDEEILQSVLSNVVSGYYYSISGDLYLQRNWQRLKSTLVPEKQKKLSALEQRQALPTPKEPKISQAKKKPVARKNTAPKRQKALTKQKEKKQEGRLPTQEAQKLQTPVFVGSPLVKDKTGSIADLVRQTTGKTYEIYKELFFKDIRVSIRKILNRSAIQKISLFGTEQNIAENHIYHFLEVQYDNPYQNWQASTEYKEVLAQGFKVDSLEQIIKDWARRKKY
ncbi:MAG: hypothetical protein P1P67_06045 [Treponema phagedenis]|uniref:hypothetical protein n=1 Tax=Treponema phagedenis TaxID=162 RepID=UPI003133F551